MHADGADGAEYGACSVVAGAVPKDVHTSGMLLELHAAASGIRAIRVHPRHCSFGSSGFPIAANGNRHSNAHLGTYLGAPRWIDGSTRTRPGHAKLAAMRTVVAWMFTVSMMSRP
jgi:hypothetical protein